MELKRLAYALLRCLCIEFCWGEIDYIYPEGGTIRETITVHPFGHTFTFTSPTKQWRV